MKTLDTHYGFIAANGVDSACRLRIFEAPAAQWLILVTELNKNPGMSVTNAAETIATEVCREYKLQPEDCVFVEHYDFRDRELVGAGTGYVDVLLPKDETFDLVVFSWSERRASSPIWRRRMKGDVELAIGEKLP